MKTSLEMICEETPAGEHAGHTCPRILVVDDDEGLRQLNRTALTISGYDVDSAEDGESAWNALQANHYDLLITDNNMPRLSGIELIRKLRSVQNTLPIILASGSIRLAVPDDTRLPSVTMLPKPYGMTELLAAVKQNLCAAPQVNPAYSAPVPVDFKTADRFPVVRETADIFTVERYTADRKREWDGFLTEAKNATFLFNRDYMDYHGDRFTDHSLMIFCNQKLAGLLPANLRSDGVLVSHEGLTYGGLVVSRDATADDVLSIFHALLEYLSRAGISKLIYKRIPAFYNSLPDDEVGYALFLLEARLFRRDCSATIKQRDRLPVGTNRKKLIRKAADSGVRIVQETSFQPFWERVLIPQLATRHGVKPVHSLEEITMLASRFPDRIKQFSASSCDDEIVAGTTIYETPTVAHAPYGAVTDQGRQLGAQALLFNSLIDQYQDKDFFDFGISNEKEGRALNHGLLEWKEGFGARCCAHDFYEIATANYLKLRPLLQHPAGMALTIPSLPQTSIFAPDEVPDQGCFTHPQAIVDDGAVIGRGTRVWAFAHVASGAVVGEECNICDQTFIEDGVRIGDRVTIKCGVFLWDGLTVEDDVFIGPNATFTNDRRPRSKKYQNQPLKTVLQEGCTLGAHSITLPGLRIGRWAMVGAGSVVTHDVPDYGLVVGAPARLRGWVCQCGEKLSSDSGRLLSCHCGRHYEQLSESEIREINLFSAAAAGLAGR